MADDFRESGLGDEANDLLRRLHRSRYLCWNGAKMEGAAHDLIMLGYAEGRRPPRHRNWYIDITPDGDAYVEERLGALESAVSATARDATVSGRGDNQP